MEEDQTVLALVMFALLIGSIGYVQSTTGTTQMNVTNVTNITYYNNATYNDSDIIKLQVNDSYFNGTVFPKSTDFKNDTLGNKIIGLQTNDTYFNSTKVKVVSTTHDVSVTGTQSITGAGFKPCSAIIFSTIDGNPYASIGMTDGTTSRVQYWNGMISADTFGLKSGKIMYLIAAVGTDASAAFTSWDSDGMTITWSKSGSPVATTELDIYFQRC